MRWSGTLVHCDTAAWLMPKSLANATCEPANAINRSLSMRGLYIS